MRVVVEVPDWVAVCQTPPPSERTAGVQILVSATRASAAEPVLCPARRVLMDCARRIFEYPEPRSARSRRSSRPARGGTGYATCLAARSCGRARSARSPRSGRCCSRLAGGLAVYGRNGQRCARCGDTVQVRRVGEHARTLYYCPGCQVRHQPTAASPGPAVPVMDPHPAAARFLADLPWRRDSLAG